MTQLPKAFEVTFEDDDDEFTELSGAVIPRLDLVKAGANGMPFLIAKGDAAGGVFSPDQVRGLLAEPEPVVKSEQVNLSGSPAAIAAMIHRAPSRKLRPGNTEQKGAPMGDDVIKADVPEGDEPLPDADEVAASAAVTVDGDPDDPASPAWEAVDAENAKSAIELTVALRRMVQGAQDREAVEAVGGDEDGAEAVFSLADALCAIDCIISILAPFAVEEQAEAEERQSDLDGLTKGQVRVAKAGRVLSSQNEASIRSASDLLETVLASLPAPVTDPVAKSEEQDMSEPEKDHALDAAAATPLDETPLDTTAPIVTPELPAVVGDAVEKAKGDPMTPVYDASGALVAMVDSTDLIPIAPAAPAEGSATEEAAETPAEEAAETPAEQATEPAEDAATIPGTDTIAAPAPIPPKDDTVTKAAQAGAAAALAEVLPMLTEKLGSDAETVALIKGLQERVEELAKMPDDRKSPILNGGTGTAGPAVRDGSTGDSLANLKKAAEDETDPVKKQAANNAVIFASIKERFGH
jgi:hypothetical protein